MILFIQHIDIEGPETIGEYFQDRGWETFVVDLSRGQQLPNDWNAIEAVVCLGGPMNVYEEDQHPFLKNEDVFIKEVLKRHIPFMGICLGSQLLAKACGARVTKSPRKEIGWFNVQLTERGQRDPIFKNIIPQPFVFQWHEDMFMIPAGAEHLAEAPGCAHQAFRVGPNAYGFQFHFEITDKSIREWSDRYFKKNPEASVAVKERMLAQYQSGKKTFHALAQTIYDNFLQVIQDRKAEISSC